MKALLGAGLVLAFSFSIPLNCSRTIDAKDGDPRSNGLMYMKGAKKPLKGMVIDYHDANKKKLKYEQRYSGGLLNGVSKSWFENGNPESVKHYADGKQHGASEEWYEDGTRKRLDEYVKGKRHGEWQTWKPNGKPDQAGTSENGNDVEVFEFYKDGSKHLLYRKTDLQPGR